MTKKQKWQLGIGLLLGSSLFIWNTFFNPTDYEILMSEALRIREANPQVKIFDGQVEPDLPDEDENNATLMGVDKNKNGIRDDIDIWINRTGGDYNKRMAMRQYALDLQYELRAAEQDETDVIEHAESALYTTYSCLDFAYSDASYGGYYLFEIAKNLEILSKNSKARKQILENIRKHSFLGKSLIEGITVENQYKACNFPIEKKHQ